MKPDFSVIIPTFNAAAKLQATLDSALQQTGVEVEIWVLDGASSDETRSVLEEYELRGVRWYCEKDRGVYDAMNKGINLAHGRYLYFLGAGDRLRPNVLQQVASHIPAHQTGLLYGQVFWEYAALVYGTPFTSYDLARRNIPHQATFYDRRLFDIVGLYNLKYSVFADYALNIACWNIPGLYRKYLPFIVADYEGDGLSARQRDNIFSLEKSQLVRSSLGILAWLVSKADTRLPQRAKNMLRLLRHLQQANPNCIT